MGSQHNDRRAQRSRHALAQSLGGLIREKRFDKITVRDIIDRADVGRTTFYAHFQSKEDLFLAGHEEIIRTLGDAFFAEDGTWRTGLTPELLGLLELFRQNPDTHFYLTWGDQGSRIFTLLKVHIAEYLASRLHKVFDEADSAIPFAVLAQHVAGSVVSLIHWWMDQRTPYPIEEIAEAVLKLNQAALRSALGR